LNKKILVLLIATLILLTACGKEKAESEVKVSESTVITEINSETADTITEETDTTDTAETTVPAEKTTAETTVKTTKTEKTTAKTTTRTTKTEKTTAKTTAEETNPPEPSSDDIIKELWNSGQSDVQIEGRGVVTKILADDNDGSRHQRFILKLKSGQTLLVAHNIDIAPRIDNLAVGNTVEFYGEYYYNEQGGGVHWTHSDPDGSHVAGYLKCKGKVYQ
jgi:hypothetical protein